MSQGHCCCPCMEWGHPADTCNGQAEGSLPDISRRASYAERPCCGPCLRAIGSVSNQGVLTPPEGVVQ